MENSNDLASQWNQPLIFSLLTLVLAAVAFGTVIEVVRRRKLRGLIPERRRSSQPNYFRRIVKACHALRRELKERNAEKVWRRNFDRMQERNAQKTRDRDVNK